MGNPHVLGAADHSDQGDEGETAPLPNPPPSPPSVMSRPAHLKVLGLEELSYADLQQLNHVADEVEQNLPSRDHYTMNTPGGTAVNDPHRFLRPLLDAATKLRL